MLSFELSLETYTMHNKCQKAGGPSVLNNTPPTFSVPAPPSQVAPFILSTFLSLKSVEAAHPATPIDE